VARDVLSVGRSPKKFQLIALLLLVLVPGFASAWGERGHNVICEVAVHLIREEGLKTILGSRGPMMGHVCNIPDIYWRSYRKHGSEADASHFLDADRFGKPVAELPLDFAVFRSMAKTEDGTLWWRADQFFRLAIADGRKAKISSRPADIYDLVVDLGLLGHFVGDGAMPYHSTADYDGWGKGHGGIHGYYETLLIDDEPLDLPMSVYRQAEKTKRPQPAYAADYAVRRMRDLSGLSLADLPELEKLDEKVILRKSERSPDGDRKKDKPAERISAVRAVPVFGDLPVRNLARGASFLAELWDQAYIRAGRPDVGDYRGFRYPLTPKFVRPDYLREME
jgi:hypothetical protein